MSVTTVANPVTLNLVRAFGKAVAEHNTLIAEQEGGDMRRGPLAWRDSGERVARALQNLRDHAGDDYANGVADGVHWAAPEDRA